MTGTSQAPILTTPADRLIVIERIFAAPRDQVWRAWTEPSLIAQWWGRGRKTVVEQMEVKKGGYWRFVVDGKNGIQGFRGRYREITPPSRFVWTMEWDGMPGYVSIDTVELEDLGNGKTRLINTSQFLTDEEQSAALKSGMMEGVRDAYLALDRLLTTL